MFYQYSIVGLLNQFKNPTINEMYTCIRPDVFGDLMPTIVLGKCRLVLTQYKKTLHAFDQVFGHA